MNTHEIQSTSIADLRFFASQSWGNITHEDVGQERLRRIEEQKDIKYLERGLYGTKGHSMRKECCPIKFSEELPRVI